MWGWIELISGSKSTGLHASSFFACGVLWGKTLGVYQMLLSLVNFNVNGPSLPLRCGFGWHFAHYSTSKLCVITNLIAGTLEMAVREQNGLPVNTILLECCPMSWISQRVKIKFTYLQEKNVDKQHEEQFSGHQQKAVFRWKFLFDGVPARRWDFKGC